MDDTIKSLIETINRIHYLETISCCGGHPEEAAVKEYGYAVANIVLIVRDEHENVFNWHQIIKQILADRKKTNPKNEFAFVIGKVYGLNEKGNLSWTWKITIQATGKTPDQCRAGLDEGIDFLEREFKQFT